MIPTVLVQPRDPATGEPTDWLPAQAAAVRAMRAGVKTDICIAGGHGSGKSECLAALAQLYAWTNPGAPILLLAQTSGDMENVVLPKFLSYLPPHHEGQAAEDRHRPESMSPAIQSVELVKKRMRLANGTMVYWGSADAKKAWEGLTVSAVFCDEIRLWDEDTFQRKARSRARDKRGPRCIVSATTPAMNWLDTYAHAPHVELVHADTRENTHLVEGYAESYMQGMSEQAIRVYVQGEFLPMSGQVFDNYSDQNVIGWGYDPTLPVRACMDFGYRRPYVGFAQEDGDRVIAFDEIVTQDRSTEQIAHQICTRDYTLEAIAVDPAGTGTSTTRGERDVDVLRNILRKKWPSVRVIYQTDPALRSIPASIDIMRGAICDHAGHRRLFVSTELAAKRYPSGLMGVHQGILASVYPDKQGGISAEQPVKDGVSDHARDSWRYYLTNFHPPRSHGQVIDIGRAGGAGSAATDYSF